MRKHTEETIVEKTSSIQRNQNSFGSNSKREPEYQFRRSSSSTIVKLFRRSANIIVVAHQ